MALIWFFEGCPRISPRTLCLYCKTLARVMQSNELSSDLPPSDMSSHIFKTLNDGQVGLVLADLVTMAHRWDESPHAGQSNPRLIIHWIEDVAATDNRIPLRDKMQPPLPRMQCPEPLTLASI
jgi:hypothetical protein